jgi:hypothetical protein
VVFPWVFIVDEKKIAPVFPGVMLRRLQTVAADQEMERIKSSSPLLGRTPPDQVDPPEEDDIYPHRTEWDPQSGD